MKMNTLKYVIPLTTSLTLIGCGGSSSTTAVAPETAVDTPAPLIKTVSLSKLNSTALGTVFSFKIAGSGSVEGIEEEVNITGTISSANRAQEMYGGVLVTPRDGLTSLSLNDDTPIVGTSTTYVDTSYNLIAIVSEGVVCTPVSPDYIPSSVKIGDFGILSTLVCDDNTTTERNWRIEDASNGNILVIEYFEEKDQYNTITVYGEQSVTLDGDGDIIAFAATGITPDTVDPDVKITYSSL